MSVSKWGAEGYNWFENENQKGGQLQKAVLVGEGSLPAGTRGFYFTAVGHSATRLVELALFHSESFNAWKVLLQDPWGSYSGIALMFLVGECLGKVSAVLGSMFLWQCRCSLTGTVNTQVHWNSSLRGKSSGPQEISEWSSSALFL